jgi:hypothetical protein
MVDRIRKVRSVTLNPELVRRLMIVGEKEGETNLSRLLDAAASEYVRARWNPEMDKTKPKSRRKS